MNPAALLSIDRQVFTAKSTRGTLTIGKTAYSTIEPPRGPELHQPGIFTATLYHSPEWTKKIGYPFLVPLIQVPGRTGIEIHIGNGPGDTLGCTCVGLTGAADWVNNSEDAFYRLMHQIVGNLSSLDSEFIVEYLEPPPPA
jgi:Family of unknown function (DUF5675)